MGRAYEQGIWAEHMGRAYGQGILAGQGGQRGVGNGMAESGGTPDDFDSRSCMLYLLLS